jgi:hypothetical protein
MGLLGKYKIKVNLRIEFSEHDNRGILGLRNSGIGGFEYE